MAPYARPHLGRSLLDLATSVVPYLALSVAMYFALDVSYLLVLVLAVPAAGFAVRTYIIFHDCGHGSFMRSRRANTWIGTFCGLLVFMPFQSWRHEHAVHHATAGDLDRRGVGDVFTLTVAEYQRAAVAGPAQVPPVPKPAGDVRPRADLLDDRRPALAVTATLGRASGAASSPRTSRSPSLIGGLCWLIGWREYLLVQAPILWLAGATGVWLFYVQHQFEDTYWQSSEGWAYADAALRGSSYLKLPKVLQFFTGNIGLHHVHHLSTRIPNYNLQRAHDENAIFGDVPVLSLWDGMRAVRLKLWDEDRQRLVTFAEARAPNRQPRRCPR